MWAPARFGATWLPGPSSASLSLTSSIKEALKDPSWTLWGWVKISQTYQVPFYVYIYIEREYILKDMCVVYI
jgi:hypothetical protein